MRPRAGIAVMTVALCAGLVACDETVQPVLQTNRPFTMYGYLNPLADTQAVRIFTIDGVLERTEPDPLDASITITNLETSDEYVLRDSVVQFPSSLFGHVYWADFRPIYGERFRIEASRSDGASVVAETRVPPEAEAEAGPADILNFALPIPILFRNAPNVVDIRVTYRSTVGVFEYDYGEQQVDVDDGSLLILQFRRDTRDILTQALLDNVDEVFLNQIDVRVVVTSEDWFPPGGAFDEDVLVEPGTFTNVENGFGFIGSGYPLSFDFRPDSLTMAVAGFDVN